VPGDYAFAEALKALKLGLHVFIFSSGVPLEAEARLKQLAERRGLLVMGPECGTALIAGQPLGFANAVRPGQVGLVGASGTGLQEVMCLIHNWGEGISDALGAGARDLHERVGALSLLAGLRLLAADPGTRVIVLISKPPAPAVADRVLAAAAAAGKPVVVAFQGAERAAPYPAGLRLAATLEDAAREALAVLGRAAPAVDMPLVAPAATGPHPAVLGAGSPWPLPRGKEPQGRGTFGPRRALRRKPTLVSAAPPRRWVRGLFAGGTLCGEAVHVLAQTLGPVAQPGAADPWPAGHFCQDLGDEAFTRGRPHPMIDARVRAERLARAAADPGTAVVLFDVVLGYGASPDPVGPLLPAIQAADPGVRWVAHVCGTEADPQNLSAQVEALSRAGVTVMPTNAAAARLAARLAAQPGAGADGGRS
jgi:succinyl-CoA synthetase alpha subunit